MYSSKNIYRDLFIYKTKQKHCIRYMNAYLLYHTNDEFNLFFDYCQNNFNEWFNKKICFYHSYIVVFNNGMEKKKYFKS